MTHEEKRDMLTNLGSKIVDICKVHNLTLQQARELCKSIPNNFKNVTLTSDMIEQPECSD